MNPHTASNVRLHLAALLLLAWTAAVPAVRAAPSRAEAGPYRVEVTTDPLVVPAVGKATLRVRLTDAAGKPVEGVTLRALTKMPGMDMGEREEPGSPVSGESGLYEVPATFAMEGGYESALQIRGPLGEVTARVQLETGQNTAADAGSPFPLVPVLGGAAAVLLLVFVLYRVRRTGQKVAWRGVFNRQVFGGLLLLGVFAAGAVYAVSHFRRKGAMTPIEAQAMDMSYLPAPTGFTPVELAVATSGGGAVESTVRYTGTATGYVEQEVYPRVTGTLVWMPLYAGDRVTKGQLLARLDTSQTAPLADEREAAAAMARQGVSVARAEASQTEAALGEARAGLVGKQGALAEAQAGVEAARQAREGAEAGITAARSEVADAEAALSGAEADRTYWRAQIGRSRALLRAGAVSGEELQREEAQAENAEANARQAQARLAQVKSNVLSAQAALRRADADIRAATARVRTSASEIGAQRAAVRAAGAAVRAARERTAQAESGAAVARASARAAAATRGYSEIRAETGGLVTQRLISPGVLVSPGQAILRIARIDPIRLQANLAESDLPRVRPGAPVRITDRDAGARKPVTARITSVTPAVDPASRMGVVEAVVSNPNGRFLPGAYVVMEIGVGRSTRGSVSVPTRAVQYRTMPAAAAGNSAARRPQPYVWVAQPAPGREGRFTVRRAEVEVGVRGKDRTEVVSGLEEGDRVVVSGAAYLRDGDAVADASDEEGGTRRRQVGSVAEAGSTAAARERDGVQTASVMVTSRGFEPTTLALRAGVPARVTFTRTTDRTCGTEVVMPAHDINKPLPLNQGVVVEFTPEKGEVGFACGMNMFKGKVVAR